MVQMSHTESSRQYGGSFVSSDTLFCLWDCEAKPPSISQLYYFRRVGSLLLLTYEMLHGVPFCFKWYFFGSIYRICISPASTAAYSCYSKVLLCIATRSATSANSESTFFRMLHRLLLPSKETGETLTGVETEETEEKGRRGNAQRKENETRKHPQKRKEEEESPRGKKGRG